MTVEPGQELSRWADAAMYRADPMPESGGGPTVTLLNATPDPLGSLAAIAGIYTGRVVRSLAQVTDEQRKEAFADMLATVLNGSLEVAQFHFLIEGVSRAFTHQAVRGRSAFYAQESLRFAVPEEQWSGRTYMPPSLSASRGGETPGAEDSDLEYMRNVWDMAVFDAETAYRHLVDRGMPAEDARGLMPHAMLTRYHWVCDLRELLHVAGLRLCTQAQFEWRRVMAEVANALRTYGVLPMDVMLPPASDGWQYGYIADQLRPVCYQQGTCGFMAKFDRGCRIRERVEANGRNGIPVSQWADIENPNHIQPGEWLTDPRAAR